MSERAASLDTPVATPPAAGSSWRWSSWSLTRKLPVLTATIVIAVVVASLALTYEALKRAREDAVHERLNRLTRQLTQASEQTVRTRVALYRQVASDSVVLAALRAATTRAGRVDTIEAQRDAAERANRAKSDFLAVMSHELRTPLNAIGGYAEILELGIHGPVTERQREALQRISRSQQMLLSLINDVLNFAKLDAGQVQYRMKSVPLRDVLGGVEDLVTPQLHAKQLTYQLAACDGSVLAAADPDKLQQVLLNLLSNAIKFTPHGGRITVSCHVDGLRAAIEVSDTGVGIEPDRVGAIFDPFVQVDRSLSRPHEGVGLGLSISRDLVRGMGGTLDVRSTPGVGSTFTIHLRRASV